MGVSIEEYRQRIGCFAGVATILSSCGAVTLFITGGCMVLN